MIGSLIQTLRATPDQEAGIVSPETLKERRALARRLMEGAVDVSPVQHWTQGAARMAQALQGVTADWAADREEKRGQAAWKTTEANLFGGASPAPANPAASPSADLAAASPNPSPVAAVKGYDRPEAREIYEAALKSGYQPHQAAAFTGAALAESSYRTDARNPGDGRDGSDSIGIFQWNGDRATGLKQFAEREGKDWRDRATQVAYALQEQQGPETFAGQAIRNAKTPEDATAAMLHYLRPAGYTRDNPMGAGSSGVRMRNTNAILSLYGGDQAQAQPAVATEGQRPPVQPAQAAPSAASQDPASGAPNRMSLAQLMAMRNSPAFAYAPKGTQELVSALIHRQVTQEARDPRDGLIKDLTIAEKRATMARDAEMMPLTRRSKMLEISKGERDMAGYRPASAEEKARLGYDKDTPIQIGPDGRAYADNAAARQNVEIIRDAATGEIIAVDKNNIDGGIKKLREAGPSRDAPTTRQIKQPDGSEVAVQWDAQSREWVPMRAPEGGNPVKAPGKLTEQQSKDLVYYNRGLQSMEVMGTGEALTGTQGLVGATVGQVPVIGNYAKSENYQQAEQASRNFLLSILRKDTGAAVTPSEEKIYGEVFLPRPGDPPSLVKQKFEARKQAIDAIRDGLGPAEVLALGQRLTRREDAKVPAPDKPIKRPADKDPLGLFQ